MASDERNTGQGSWHVRRRIIFAALAYCLGSSLYAQIFQGAEMVGAVLPANATLATAVIGSYVFGAVWEDKNK